MACGFDVHKARKVAISALGRDLSRHARIRCESLADAPLTVLEIPPTMGVLALGAVLSCDRGRTLLDGGLKRVDVSPLSFLGESVWSELLPVQLISVGLLRELADHRGPWAQEAAEVIWLDEDIEALV